MRQPWPKDTEISSIREEYISITGSFSAYLFLFCPLSSIIISKNQTGK